MPISSSETRTKWKKRKREPRKPKQPQDDDVLDDAGPDEDDDNDFDPNSNPNPNNHEGSEEGRNQNPSFGPDRAGGVKESEALFNGGERINEFPLVIRRQVSRPHSSVVAIAGAESAGMAGESRGANAVMLENVSYGQLQVRSAVPLDCPALFSAGVSEEKGEGSYVITPPRIIEGHGVVKRFGSAGRVHVVPMHADWFSPNTVYRLEKQVVPHFFSAKSPEHTPEKYMQCRNWIVAKYMEHPEKHLSVADCQGLIAGVSIDDVTRIVRFLDHWGIINYCADASSREPHKEGECLSEDLQGELCVPSTALKSIDSLIKFERPKCRLKAADVYPELACRSDDDTDYDGEIREQLSDSRCNHCSQPIAVVYYQSQKEVDVLLCSDCFHEGRFVPGHSSLDFVKANSMHEYGDMDGENWTDQETFLLLEGMQLYKEKWNEIAEHVGTKSKAQCILHFVGMPVGGAPLQSIEVPSTSKSASLWNIEHCERSHSDLNGNLAGTSMQGSDTDSRFPFANSGNPVMSLIAFVASAVGPRVAAACAHASLEALCKDDVLDTSGSTMQVDGSRHSNSVHGKEESHRGEMKNSNQMKDEKLGGQRDAESSPISAEKVIAAAKAGLAAAATKSKLFADHEEREIQRLSANVINHQLKRLELKLKQFAEVETYLMRECEGMERTRQRAAAERAHMMTTQFGSAGVPRPTGLSNIGPAVAGNNTGNNRQQAVSGTPQPFIPGFGNNHSMHPHMSLMSQQAMYGLGPRLPLSALHPSPSPSNAMFNTATNSQPAHPMLRPVSGTKSGLG